MAGFQVLFNYTDPSNYNVVNFGSYNAIIIAQVSGGTTTAIYSSGAGGCGTTDATGPSTVTVSGTSVTVVAGGCTATGTITQNASATRAGISNYAGAAITVNSFSVANQ